MTIGELERAESRVLENGATLPEFGALVAYPLESDFPPEDEGRPDDEMCRLFRATIKNSGIGQRADRVHEQTRRSSGRRRRIYRAQVVLYLPRGRLPPPAPPHVREALPRHLARRGRRHAVLDAGAALRVGTRRPIVSFVHSLHVGGTV